MLTSTPRWGPFSLCALLVTLLAASAPAQTAGDEATQLVGAFRAAYRTENWTQAIELGLKLNRHFPNSRVHRYNLACVYARGGDAENAVTWLRKAAKTGFAQLGLMESDLDLATLRDNPGYRAALELVRKNVQRDRDTIQRSFERRKPLIVTPPKHNPQRPAPLLIALHGYGGRSEGYPLRWRDAAAEFKTLLVAPQGPVAIEGGGYSWVDVDTADYVLELTLDHVRRQHKIDESRIVLTGFSQGAYIAYSLGQRHPEMFTGVIPMAGPYIPELDKPTSIGDHQSPRYYFMVGEKDRMVSVADVRQTAADFSAAGYVTKLIVYPGVGHRFPSDCNHQLRKALEFAFEPRASEEPREQRPLTATITPEQNRGR